MLALEEEFRPHCFVAGPSLWRGLLVAVRARLTTIQVPVLHGNNICPADIDSAVVDV
jgi:hypothetical protein